MHYTSFLNIKKVLLTANIKLTVRELSRVFFMAIFCFGLLWEWKRIKSDGVIYPLPVLMSIVCSSNCSWTTNKSEQLLQHTKEKEHFFHLSFGFRFCLILLVIIANVEAPRLSIINPGTYVTTLQSIPR